MDCLHIFYNSNDFYRFNNVEVQSDYITCSWSNQLLDPTRLYNWLMVESGSIIGSFRF